MEITKSLKERFCKDNAIGIKIFDEPYFSDRLALYNRVMTEDCIIEKYNNFVEYLNSFNSEHEYFDEYGRIKDEAINAIKSNSEYQRFNTLDFNKNNIKYDLQYPEKEIYKDYNVGKFFISIDMTKANFTALRCFSPEIFGNTSTWDEFLGKFTSSEYIRSSKYIRQVIMGNCNPGRQITYEKYLMGQLLKELEPNKLCVFSVKSDEIIIDVTEQVKSSSKETVYSEFKSLVLNKAKLVNENLNVRVELFCIESIDDTSGYKRIYFDGEEHTEFKCLNSYTAPIAFRNLLGETVTDSDRTFVFENKLARFI